MTVKELIERLKEMDQEKLVVSDWTGTVYRIDTVEEEDDKVVISWLYLKPVKNV